VAIQQDSNLQLRVEIRFNPSDIKLLCAVLLRLLLSRWCVVNKLPRNDGPPGGRDWYR
jgi:hypothetical protein